MKEDQIQISVSREELTAILLNRAKKAKGLSKEETETVLNSIMEMFNFTIDYDAAVSLLILALPLVGVILSPQIMALIYGIGKLVSNKE